MVASAKTEIKVGRIPLAGNAGTPADIQVSKHDLKLLSLEFIGETAGTYYFRDPSNPARTFSGDREDYVEYRIARDRHPLMDAATAAAALQMRQQTEQMAAVIFA